MTHLSLRQRYNAAAMRSMSRLMAEHHRHLRREWWICAAVRVAAVAVCVWLLSLDP